MLSANINSIVAGRMISNLAKTGLLDSVRNDDTLTYLVTPKGIEFIAMYLELQAFISPDLVPETRTKIVSRVFGQAIPLGIASATDF